MMMYLWFCYEINCFIQLSEAFDHLDEDRSGYITGKNLKKLLGKNFSDREIKDIIEECDLTGDRRVSRDEFMKLMIKGNGCVKEKKGHDLPLLTTVDEVELQTGATLNHNQHFDQIQINEKSNHGKGSANGNGKVDENWNSDAKNPENYTDDESDDQEISKVNGNGKSEVNGNGLEDDVAMT